MRLFKARYKDRKGAMKAAAKWYVEFRDHLDRTRRLALYTDRKASEEAGRRIDRLVALKFANALPDPDLIKWLAGMNTRLRLKLADFGLIDKASVQSSRPLTVHLVDWKQALLAKGTSERQAYQAPKRVERVLIEGCKCRYYTDISSTEVRAFMSKLRTGMMVPSKQAGKPPRLQRINAQTSNHFLGACRSFCMWMVREGRAQSNPLECLLPLNEKTIKKDMRHPRRIEPPQVVARLLAKTATEPERFGMDGPARSLLYRLAVETGLRAGELASLKCVCFKLDVPTPYVAIEGSDTKNAKDAEIPLLPSTVQLLKEHLANKLPLAQAFAIPQKQLVSKMFYQDLESAGIEPKDAQGRFFDFHSLRHCTATYLADQGVHPNTVKDIMRHSDLRTTLRYFKATAMAKRAEALRSMPDLSAAPTEPHAREATNDKQEQPDGEQEA